MSKFGLLSAVFMDLRNHSLKFSQTYPNTKYLIEEDHEWLHESWGILYHLICHILSYIYTHIMYSIFPNNHWSTMNIPISWVLGNIVPASPRLHHDFLGKQHFQTHPNTGNGGFKPWNFIRLSRNSWEFHYPNWLDLLIFFKMVKTTN